jgi:hypothetical protein
VRITGECVVVVLLELDLEDGALDRTLLAAGVGGADDAASVQRFLRLLDALQCKATVSSRATSVADQGI